MLRRITRGPFQRRFTACAAACISGSHPHLQAPQQQQHQDSLRACFAALPRETSALRLCSSSSVPSGAAAPSSSSQEPAPTAEPKGAAWYQHPYPRAAELEKVVREKQQRITELEAMRDSREKQLNDLLQRDDSDSKLNAITSAIAGIRADIAAAKKELQQARDALDTEMPRVTRDVVAWLRSPETKTIRSVWGHAEVLQQTDLPLFHMRCREHETNLFKAHLGDMSQGEDRCPFIVLTSTPRQGKTAFLDWIARNGELVQVMLQRMGSGTPAQASDKSKDKDSAQMLSTARVFSTTFNSAFGLQLSGPCTVQEAICQVAIRVLCSAGGIKTSRDEPGAVTAFVDAARKNPSQVTIQQLVLKPLRAAGLIDANTPAIFLFDELTKLTDCIHDCTATDGPKAASSALKGFYSELKILLSSTSAVVVSGFSQTDVIAATSDAGASTSPRTNSGRGVLSVPLLPVTDVVTRRDMLVMKSALIRSAAITASIIKQTDVSSTEYAHAVTYYELLKSSPGALGSVLQSINSSQRTVSAAVRQLPILREFRGDNVPVLTERLCDAVSLLSMPGAASSDLVALQEVEQTLPLLSVQMAESCTAGRAGPVDDEDVVFVEPLFTHELVRRAGEPAVHAQRLQELLRRRQQQQQHQQQQVAAGSDCTVWPHELKRWTAGEKVLGYVFMTLKASIVDIPRAFGEEYVRSGGLPDREARTQAALAARGRFLEDSLVAGLQLQRAARNRREQMPGWAGSSGASAPMPLTEFLAFTMPVSPAPESSFFLGHCSAHIFKQPVSATDADIRISLSTKLFTDCGCDKGTFNRKRGATESKEHYPLAMDANRTVLKTRQELEDADAALALLSRTIIKPHAGQELQHGGTDGGSGDSSNSNNTNNGDSKSNNGGGDRAAAICATQLLLVPKRDETTQEENNPLADVIFHEFAGDVKLGKHVQFLVDTKHGTRHLPFLENRRIRNAEERKQDLQGRVQRLVDRICDSLQNRLLQDAACTVDHVVLIYITPALRKEVDFNKLLSWKHTAKPTSIVAALAAAAGRALPATHQEAIQTALGRLTSFHIVVLQSHDVGLQNLISQLSAFTLPLMDAHDSEAGERMLLSSPKQWRTFCAGRGSKDTADLEKWSKDLEGKVKRNTR